MREGGFYRDKLSLFKLGLFDILSTPPSHSFGILNTPSLFNLYKPQSIINHKPLFLCSLISDASNKQPSQDLSNEQLQHSRTEAQGWLEPVSIPVRRSDFGVVVLCCVLLIRREGAEVCCNRVIGSEFWFLVLQFAFC